MDAGQAHRGEVEGRMTFSTYRDFSKIYHFAGNSQKRYLEFYFMKYEIATLKACMRNIMDCRADTIPILVDKHFKRHSKLNIDHLIASHTVEEFIENLNGSVYEKPMKKIMTLDNPRLFDYEMSLDLFFFNYIWNHQEHFVPKGEKVFHQFFWRTSRFIKYFVDLPNETLLYGFLFTNLRIFNTNIL